MKKSLVALFVGLMFIFAIFPSAVQGQVTLYVDDDGVECPWATYTTIQAAVSDASNGDTIYVCAGTYSESVSVVGFTSLTITAQGSGLPDKSVLVNPTPTGLTDGFYVISDGVTIEGFEIADTNFGIWFEGSNNKFSNNYIHGIAHTGGPEKWWNGGVGISLWDMNGGSNYNAITNNVIEDIERTGILLDVAWTDRGSGINTGNSVVNNAISHTPWGAIEVLNAEYTSVNNNEISDCGDWGIALFNAETGVGSNYDAIAGNNISGCHSTYWGVGIVVWAWAGSAEQATIHHNNIQHVTGIGTGIWILGNYNTIHHNSVDSVTVTNPYWDSGTGNKAFKNSWP